MTEVTVVFPSGGGLNVEERETCLEGASLRWRVGSFNTDVKKVLISFDAGVNFFEGSHLSPLGVLAYGGASGTEHAELQVPGRAPGVAATTTYKYTVTGFKANGQKVEELDPRITVVRDIG